MPDTTNKNERDPVPHEPLESGNQENEDFIRAEQDAHAQTREGETFGPISEIGDRDKSQPAFDKETDETLPEEDINPYMPASTEPGKSAEEILLGDPDTAQSRLLENAKKTKIEHSDLSQMEAQLSAIFKTKRKM